jgi:hypothetical protein
MLHYLVILGWVIGFASATLLAISITMYQTYKKDVEQRRFNSLGYDIISEQQSEEIEKWKRKVFRP